MARELGGSQISALLESVPGIANVLRSPVADALVHMIRAGAGLEGFQLEHAKELIQYAERRGLVGSSEAEELLAEVSAVAGKRRGSARSGAKKSGGASRPKPKPRPFVPEYPPYPCRSCEKGSNFDSTYGAEPKTEAAPRKKSKSSSAPSPTASCSVVAVGGPVF